MVAGFKKRKIKPKATLGDILKLRRRRKKLTLDEVEDATRIRVNFLEAIEEERWDRLPSTAYSRGYVARYAEFLNLSPKKLLEQFDRESHLFKRSFSQLSIKDSHKPLTTMWLLTPKMTAVLVGTAVIIFLATFVGFQVKSFAAAPKLTIIAPSTKNNLTIKIDTIKLVGQTSPDAQVEINGQPVEVADNGRFEQKVALSQGQNTFVVKATNRSNKSKAELVTVKSEGFPLYK